MADNNSLGSILRRLRREKRKKTIEAAQWTQESVARRIGVSRVTYIAWEKDEWQPDTDHLKRIIEVFRPNEKDVAALYRAVAQPPPEIFDLPFLRSHYFTGRETYSEQLRQFLQENGIVSLTGLAGIGKTQIALEYAYSLHPDVYRTVLWVNGANKAMLETEYASLAQTLGLPEKDDQELKQRIRAVKIWLRTHTNWLLIIDNADELPIVRPFLLPKPLGHIVLTTRWQFTDKFGKPLAIEAMGSEEGLLFLWRRTRTEQDESKGDTFPQDIREPGLQLVEELGGHALALEQTGAYIQETSVSFVDYLKLYEENRRSLLDQYGALDDEHITVAATFKTSFARARDLAPMAEDILHFCAFLQPDAIPEELFQHDESFKSDAMAFNKGIAALLRYSLIKRNTQKKTFSMHRLVQAVLIDDMGLDLQKQWRERVVRALNAIFPKPPFWKYQRQCKRLLPHVLAACANSTDNDVTLTEELADLLHRIGSYLGVENSESEIFLKRSLSIYERLNEVGHPDSACPLTDLAGHYMRPGKYRQAEPLLVRALAIYNKYFGDEHPDSIRTVNLLAMLYHMQGEYGQIELLYQRVLRMCEKHVVAEHPGIAEHLPMLAAILRRHGQHEQAEALDQYALSINEQRFGKEAYLTLRAIKKMYEKNLDRIEHDAEAAALEEDDEPSV
jgi:DNA-binding XRE family transcriptional regulator